jgi:iron complex outermembrane receptor protein
LDGFSLGSGIYVVGQREGDNANTLQLAGYARWDAMAAYRFKIGKTRLTTQLSVNNILDKQYYKNTDTLDGNPRRRISVGEPLTLMGSVKLEF